MARSCGVIRVIVIGSPALAPLDGNHVAAPVPTAARPFGAPPDRNRRRSVGDAETDCRAPKRAACLPVLDAYTPPATPPAALAAAETSHNGELEAAAILAQLNLHVHPQGEKFLRDCVTQLAKGVLIYGATTADHRDVPDLHGHQGCPDEGSASVPPEADNAPPVGGYWAAARVAQYAELRQLEQTEMGRELAGPRFGS